jgi:succinate dehydrogenase hydrophobic anchor subunit
MEPIEKFKVFRRVEEKWSETKEEKRIFKQLIMIIRNPSRAFWMITKNPKKGGVWVIILLNAVLFGLMASAIVWRTQISQFGAVQMNFNTYYLRWIMDFEVWLSFFVFGFIYYILFFMVWTYFFSLAADFTVGLKEIIKKRNLDEKDKEKEMKSDIGGKYESLTKKKKIKMFNILGYAMTPTLVANAISFILVLIFLPTVNVGSTYNHNIDSLAQLYEGLFNSPVWGVVDFVNIVIMIGWLPITMAIAIRDVSKTDTLKVLISSVIVSILLTYLFFFLRPTLGWNLNIIQNYIN